MPASLQMLGFLPFYTAAMFPYVLLAAAASATLTFLLRRWPSISMTVTCIALAPILLFLAGELLLVEKPGIEWMPALFIIPVLLGWVAGGLFTKLILWRLRRKSEPPGRSSI
jgi:hypothetical protein